MAMKQLHPGAKWLFRLRALFTAIFFSIFLGIWASALFAGIFRSLGASVAFSFLMIILSLIIIAIVLIEVYARMAYNRWFYEFTGDQLRIERGIIWKKYSNIPYQRIQNVDITRGIIARICGFSSVNIQTAGYSMPTRHSYGTFSEGYLPAVPVDEAEKIREFVIKKIGKRYHQGM